MSYCAEIIAVGTELLLGNVANTDARFLSEKLSEIGVNVLYHTSVGDNPARLKEIIAIARKRANLLVFTGGLGPTYDDLTKQVVAEAFGLELEFHPEILEEIRIRYRDVIKKPMPECNRQQAYLPAGCTVIHNSVGTAPACLFVKDGITAAMLPGVPHECCYLAENCLIPLLRSEEHAVIVSHELRVFGLGESLVQEKLRDIMDDAVNPSVAPYAKTGEMLLRVTAKAETAEECEEMMAPVTAEIHRRLGCYIYGTDVDSLEQQVKNLLAERHRTFSAAESCTGGLIAKRITDIPGASGVFPGGVVSYSNGVKAGVLGVPQETLDEYGAVSEPTARAMAEGVRRVTGTDYGVSVTGLAGPDGDDRGNPVGTVFIAIADGENTTVQRLNLGGGRQRIRNTAAHYVFDMLRRTLAGYPLEGE